MHKVNLRAFKLEFEEPDKDDKKRDTARNYKSPEFFDIAFER